MPERRKSNRVRHGCGSDVERPRGHGNPSCSCVTWTCAKYTFPKYAFGTSGRGAASHGATDFCWYKQA